VEKHYFGDPVEKDLRCGTLCWFHGIFITIQ
jgi:hypothetical protein